MGDASSQCKLHEFFGWRTHILEPLSKWNNGKAHSLEVLHHLHRAPAVKGNLPYIKPCAKLFDKFLNKAVMNNISLRGHKQALTLPQVVGNMIALYPKVKSILRHPEVRQDTVFVLLILRREYQHKRRDVRGT